MSDTPVSTTVHELLGIMTVRLKMQEKGITFPDQSIKNATRQLVLQLELLAPEEEIDIVIVRKNPLVGRYIRVKTGQILAEVYGQDNSIDR